MPLSYVVRRHRRFILTEHTRRPSQTGWLRLENRHTGETLFLRRLQTPEGGQILAIRGSLPPQGTGPPLHLHVQENEYGTVTSGRLGAYVGGKEITLESGGSTSFPAGVLHHWWNAGEGLLQFEGTVRPVVDLDRFLQAVFAVLNAGTADRPNLFYMVHVLHRHRDTQFAALTPKLVQRILFPVLIMIGRILGKYRGDSWPGSPASCVGAPVANDGT